MNVVEPGLQNGKRKIDNLNQLEDT